ncbi:AI-2E family transporter [Caballeronia sp. LZ035]|uniref:AI-2E family transporter n=1 Tax=Caballeronia sp. LZ035 TaxID=3038568 RepID=UPI00285A54E8|nr:AI-2E family transporter [Caballeronia sp. LZ035]MDR5763205.1 AI-2E family transporter [Caballeronia sp. LZ035]
MSSHSSHRRSFQILLAVSTFALCWILRPFFGAIFWGAILALLFQPMQRYLSARLGRRRNLAAFITLVGTVVIVILPLSFVVTTLVQEISSVYTDLQSGRVTISGYFQHALGVLPAWATTLLRRFGVADLAGMQKRLLEGASAISQFAGEQAVMIGQNTFEFVVSFGVMLYLTFFLLRDGAELGGRFRRALPLDRDHKEHLISKFSTVVRATVKGNMAVAAAQGILGGLIFFVLGIEGSLLWGVLMAFLSLLPAIGSALVWAPAAAYLLLTGALVKGLVLIVFCVVVIGLVDNILRPLLVGKDVGMPDWCVLLSTLGGLAAFGINGFVIGPLVVALFLSAWDLHTQDDEANESSFPLPMVATATEPITEAPAMVSRDAD